MSSSSTQISVLNPTTTYELLRRYVVCMLFEGLTRLEEKGDTALGVAKKYTVSTAPFCLKWTH